MEFVHLIVPYYHRSDSCTVVLVQNCALKFLRSRPKSRFGAQSPDSKCALRVCPRGPSENSHFHELCPVCDVPLGPKPRYVVGRVDLSSSAERLWPHIRRIRLNSMIHNARNAPMPREQGEIQ